MWPASLIFDYGAGVQIPPAAHVAGALVSCGLLGLVGWSLRRRPVLGFTGFAFLALLAPSSSVVPIATQAMGEHRVHLALAAPLVLACVAAARLAGPRLLWLTPGAALALGFLTFTRNADYASVETLWRDTVAKCPANARAHFNLGLALRARDATTDAIGQFEATLAQDDQHREARRHLSTLLLQTGRTTEALAHRRTLLAQEPASAAAHYGVAVPLLILGQTAEALPHLTESVRLDPAQAEVRANLGRALAALGRHAEALTELEAAARLDPEDRSSRENAERIRAFLRQ